MQRTRSSARRSDPRFHQLTFSKRGGARRGAGRKPKGATACVPHKTRPVIAARHPVLVTLKLVQGCPSLRRTETRELLHGALRAGRERNGLRLVHFSIMSNHVHALVEARDARALSCGMQGLGVRIARALNRAWQREGRLFADRFHARALKTPREVRYALAYVLNNARKHGVRIAGVDPFSSGCVFDGWREGMVARPPLANLLASVVVPPRTWLLAVGWLRHGRIRIREVPASST